MIDLKMVIENYPYCLKNSSNLRALLKDLYPELEYRSRIFIISVILDSNVLRTIKTSVEITETDIYKLAKSLVNEYGFSEDLCIECLELWSTSLGKYKGQTIKVNKIKENISKPTKIIKQLKNNMFTIKDGCLTKYTGKSVCKVTIPEGVTSIGAKAFSRAEVQYVYLPSTCMSIEDSAFEYSEVAEIVLPDGLENIGSGAFAYCEKLRKIVLPPKIKSIYRDTFYKCKALSNVELNEGLTSIGEMAFCDCQSLVSVEVPKSVKSISSSAFLQCDRFFTIIGEKGSYAEKYSKNKMFKFEKKE